MKEIYRPIDGFDNYMVSNYGNIKNIKPFHKSSSGEIKGKLDKDGYVVVGIKNNSNVRKYVRVHRLVALEFCENKDKEKFTIVNHKNGIKNDNRADNLEWCDISYNTKHGFEVLGRKPVISNGRKVIQLHPSTYEPIKIYNTIKEASDGVNVHPSSIRNCLNKRKNGIEATSGGYRWEYSD